MNILYVQDFLPDLPSKHDLIYTNLDPMYFFQESILTKKLDDTPTFEVT